MIRRMTILLLDTLSKLYQIKTYENGNVVRQQMTDPQYTVAVRADSNGDWTYTWKDLPVKGPNYTNTYTVVEEVPEGYQVSYSDAGNGVFDEPITVTNTQLSELVITKNVTVEGQPTSGTAADGDYYFTVTGPGIAAALIKKITITNGESNSVRISDLEPGTYTIRELDVEGPATPVDQSEYEITIENGQVGETAAQVSFTNNVTYGSLAIQKTSTGATTPDDAVFIITGPNNYSRTITYRDIKSGTYKLNNLLLGTYTITEKTDKGDPCG